MSFSTQTKLNLIIGDPVEQSLSPFLHNLFYKKLGLESQFVFLANQLKSENLKEFVKAVKLLKINGLSVTIPHKSNITEFLDEIQQEAKIIGAVNTVIVDQNQKLVGYNTDWLGILIPLLLKHNPNFELSLDFQNYKQKKIPQFLIKKISAVIGSGGASRAACFALLSCGSQVWVFNRTFDKAKKIQEDFDICFPGKIKAFELKDLKKVDGCQIIFNSTDLGMLEKKHLSPVTSEFLNSEQILFDAVYKPKKTKFLKTGEDLKATTIGGLEMLIWQAVFQLQLQTNAQLSLQIIEQVKKNLIKKG